MVDMRYDPISMKEIDPLFGTMEDMKNLIQASHERKLKVVMDFVPNHVSDQSEWFKRSVDRDGPYTDYFVWHDGKRVNDSCRIEPNNWVGWFEKSAWKWNEKRQQYYFRLFKNEQPDLNLRNPAVQVELETESHDQSRTSTRMGTDAIDAFTMLNLILPGSACVYYGNEIGLEDSMIRDDQKVDKTTDSLSYLRDRSRGPMPWDGTENGGFTTNKTPWLPLSTKYWSSNVKNRLQEANSHLKIFKRLMALRKTVAAKYGDLKKHVVNTWTYLFTRDASNETIAVSINLGSESEAICSEESNFGLPETMFVHTGSLNSGFKIGDEVRIISSKGHSCTELRPKAGLVLTTYPTSAAIVWSAASWLLFLAIGMLILY